jgi:hypothetical protein
MVGGRIRTDCLTLFHADKLGERCRGSGGGYLIGKRALALTTQSSIPSIFIDMLKFFEIMCGVGKE